MQTRTPARPRARRVLVAAVACGLGLIALGWSAPGSAQTVTGETRLKDILAEAQRREAAAAKYVAKAKTELETLEALQRQALETRTTQRNLKARQFTLGRELDDARQAEAKAEAELLGLEQRLGSRLAVLYKLRAGGGLPGLYEARDFQSSLRVSSAFEKILASDLAVFERFQAVLAERREASRRRQAAFEENEGSKSAYLESKREEMKREIDKRNQLDILRRKAEREEAIARELREQAERLRDKIDSAGATPVV